jgi:thioredoxin-related protein
MKFIFISVLSIWQVLCFSSSLSAQGIEFFSGTWQEAVEAAKKQDKLLFVDAYATWCGPCKKMARDVFTTKEAGDYFNRYFINVKMDMERGDGLIFRDSYPVSAFPTLFFIQPDGAVVHKVVGAQATDQLIKLGKFALTKVDDSGDFAKQYEEGDRDPELILKYVMALNKAGKPSLKVVNTYLQSKKDEKSETFLRIVYEGTTESDSRVFDELIAHQNQIEALYSTKELSDKIEVACKATNAKAITFNSTDLHELAIANMKKYNPDRAKEFILSAEMDFYKSSGQPEKYYKALIAYASSRVKTDPTGISNLAGKLFQENRNDPAAIKAAEAIARDAAKYAKTYEADFTLAQIYKHRGKKKDAIDAANKAKKKAAADERIVQYIDSFLQEL